MILQSMPVNTSDSLAMPWHNTRFREATGFLLMKVSPGYTRITKIVLIARQRLNAVVK